MMLDMDIPVTAAAFDGSPIDDALFYCEEESSFNMVLEVVAGGDGCVQAVTSCDQRHLLDMADDPVFQLRDIFIMRA